MLIFNFLLQPRKSLQQECLEAAITTFFPYISRSITGRTLKQVGLYTGIHRYLQNGHNPDHRRWKVNFLKPF